MPGIEPITGGCNSPGVWLHPGAAGLEQAVESSLQASWSLDASSLLELVLISRTEVTIIFSNPLLLYQYNIDACNNHHQAT